MGWTCGTYTKYKYIQGFGYPLKKWLGWPQSQFEVFRRREKFLAPVGMRILALPASSRIPCSKMWIYQNVRFVVNKVFGVISGFHYGVREILYRMGRYVAWINNQSRTFREKFSVQTFLNFEEENDRLFRTVCKYRGADKSLAWPGRKQATATEDFDFHMSYLLS